MWRIMNLHEQPKNLVLLSIFSAFYKKIMVIQLLLRPDKVTTFIARLYKVKLTEHAV